MKHLATNPVVNNPSLEPHALDTISPRVLGGGADWALDYWREIETNPNTHTDPWHIQRHIHPDNGQMLLSITPALDWVVPTVNTSILAQGTDGLSSTDASQMAVMIVVDTHSEVNPKETKAQLTTTAGALDMRGFN